MATPKHMKAIFITLILLTVIPIAAMNPGIYFTPFDYADSTSNMTNLLTNPVRASLIAPGPNLGITNWTHNHLTNPAFETWSTPNIPTDWGVWRTVDRYAWFATQPPDHVSEGTYSAGQTTRSSSSERGYSYWYQSGFNADMHNLTLDFDWYVATLPDSNWDTFFVYLRTSDAKYLYYYLTGGTSIPIFNATWQVYYRLGEPQNSWNNFYRNVTADYLAAPDFPSSISPGLVVTNIYFYLQSGTSTYTFIESFFDDVKLINETITYIGGSTRDGNLETGTVDPWYNTGNNNEAYITQSSSSHSGVYSANLTALSNGNSSFGQLYQWPEVRITNENQGSFGFWWQLNQDNTDTGDWAMVNFQFYDFTNWFRIWYIIGYSGLTPFSNGTWDKYLLIDNFNTTGSWQYFQCNIWQEMSALFSSSDPILDTIYFSASTRNPQAKIELLVDDVQIKARAINAADFEDQRNLGSPIYGWGTAYSNYVTVTDQAYSGGKAANCSFSTFDSAYLYQNLHERPLNSTRETYLDAMWRIEDFALGRIMFQIQFTDSKILSYQLGISDWGALSNSSMTAYYNVTGSGTIGSWIQMHRDLVHDYESAFGSLPDVGIWVIEFYAYSENAPLEILLDDIYLYDDPAPRLTNPMMPATPPLHNDPVPLDVNAEDQDLDTVMLIYRINSGVYNFLPMAHLTGTTYRATIPGQPWDTLVEYFFQANDTWGMTTTLQNGPDPYQYTVDENISPDLTIDAPSDGVTVTGTVTIEVTATDAESGMAMVEFAVDGTNLHTDMSAPYSYSWDSTTITDGTHSIDITATDNAGNEATDSVSITVSNVVLPPPPVIPGFPLGSILLGLTVALMMIVIIRRRKP